MMWMLMLSLLVPQDSAKEKEIENKIAAVKMTVNFQNSRLAELVDYIREIAGVNIVIDGKTGAADHAVSIKVQNLSVRSILKLVVAGTDFGYTYQDDVLFITDIATLNRKLVLELYDIRDLLHPLQDFPGIDFQLTDGITPSWFPSDDPSEGDVLPVEELVQTHTGKGFWDENPDASVALNNGILVVKATRDVHREVRRLLRVLRVHK